MERYYPCDASGMCPYGEGGGMYFCRDHCGLGVEDLSDPAEEYFEEREEELYTNC